jgi:hypothetical protein
MAPSNNEMTLTKPRAAGMNAALPFISECSTDEVTSILVTVSE